MHTGKTAASRIAVGGVMAALAVTIMSLGGLIPIATYVSPMLCILLLQFVWMICGERNAWAWYGAVAILGLLLGPDKEAGAMFLFLGYYPIIKPKLDMLKYGLIIKGLLFNINIGIMYWLLLNLFGMAELNEEFQDLGYFMGGVLLILGNITFYLLDRVLGMNLFRKLGIYGRK